MNISFQIIKRKDFILKKGCHNKNAMIIVLEGSFESSIGGEKYFAEKNDIFVFNKDSYFERNIIEELRCIYIQFEKISFNFNNGIIQLDDLSRKENTIFHLEQAIENEHFLMAEHLVRDIFMMYWQENNIIVVRDDIVLECIKFFDDNYSVPITLEYVADKFSVSKQGLILKFKKSTGKTPIEYLNNLRVSRSKVFLTDTCLTVGEIADKCGFENIYYFSNTFKRFTGMSPSMYRSRFQL